MSLLDIHANLSYSAIAPIIGLEPFASHTLSAKCPYCGAFSWSVYQDSKTLEEWHYCSQCKATGSIIAMAAERLELSEQAAIEFLAAKLNTKIDFKTLQQFHVTANRKTSNLKIWQNSQQRFLRPTTEEIRFLKKLGYFSATQLAPDRMLEGPGKLFGLANAEFVEKQAKFEKYTISRKNPTIVIPYFRTPTVIGGFDFLMPSKNVHYTGLRNKYVKTDLGFVGLQFLGNMHTETVVASSLVHNVLQMQVRHFSSSIKPLPLIGYKINNKKEVSREWYALSDKSVVIWEREPTAQIIKQAMVVGANLSFVGPEKDRNKGREVKGSRWRKWVRHVPPLDLWSRIVNNSRPYKEAVSVWARSATPDQKLRLLKDAEMYDEEVAKLVRAIVQPSVKTQVGRRVRVPIEVAKARPDGNYKSTLITEREGKWYDVKGQLVINGVIRVDQVVVRPSGKKDYAGKLIVEGEEYKFVVDCKKANMQWLREFALMNEVYLEERFFENTIQSTKVNPFEVAIYMQTPEAVVGLEKIGWDGSGFQFKNAKLFKGNFERNPEFKLPNNSPGPKQHFSRMREEVKSALRKDGKEMEVVWGMAIALCAQITSPCVELEPLGIWVHRALDPFMQTLWNRFELRIGEYTDWPHKWPRRLLYAAQAVHKDVTGFFAVNSGVKPEYRDLIVLEANDADLQPRLITHSADKIVLNYLRHFTTLDAPEVKSWEEWLSFTNEKMREVFPFAASSSFSKAIERLSLV